MIIQNFISKEDVKKICNELNIRDWTELKNTSISDIEAKTILDIVNIQKMNIRLEDFKKGLEVELEHGLIFSDTNVTNNHPVVTGKIVLAHMKESLDYYKLLEVAELEGDLLKAIKNSDIKKIKEKYKRLAQARLILNQSILDQINS